MMLQTTMVVLHGTRVDVSFVCACAFFSSSFIDFDFPEEISALVLMRTVVVVALLEHHGSIHFLEPWSQ